MKKLLKIAGVTLGVLLLVALVAPMALRGKISDIVKREANGMLAAKLDFERLNISLLRHFPHASVELKGLTLVGAGRFEGDTIAAASRISVVVDLMSLFGDSGFEVTKVILASPSLHAHKLEDGAVNWDVMKPSDEAAPAGTEETAGGESSEGGSAFRLSVRDFRISDASIRYEDDSTGMRFSTTPLSLRLRGDLSADHTSLDLKMKAGALRLVSGGIPLLSDAESEFEASIDADLANGRYTFSENRLRLNAIELTLDGWAETGDESLNLDMRAACEEVQFKDVLSLVPALYTRDYRGLQASGELSMSLWAKGEMRGGTLPAFEFKTEVRDGSFRYASLPAGVTDIGLDLSVTNPGGTMDRTEVDLSEFGFTMAGNRVAATLYATHLASDPTFRASASGRVDLGTVGKAYPLEKGTELGGRIAVDAQVSGRMSDIEKNRYDKLGAKGTLVVEELGLTLPQLPDVKIRRAAATISPAALTLGEFGLTVGRSDVEANGQLTNYIGYLLRGDRLSGRLYVQSDCLDLNELLSSATSAPAAGETDGDPADAAEEVAAATEPLVVPQNLDLSLNADLKEVLFQKMTLSDVSGEIRVSGGAVSLERLSLGAFGGKATASGRFSTAGERPSLSLAASMSKGSFAKTFEQLEVVQQLAPVFEKTGGDYSLSLDLSTALDASLSPDLGTLTASGELRSEHIEIQNLKAFDALATALKNDNLRRIEARDVAVRFAVRDGRVTTQPFDLQLGDVAVNLGGSTGLDQTIDYTARVSLPDNGILQTVDVGIGGTFTDPKVSLDVKQAAEQAVKNVVDEQIQKLTGSESLSDEVAKQAENLRAEAERAGNKLIEAAREQRTKLVEAAASKGALAKLAAEKAGDKLVSEAEKQAENLRTEAERQIEKLTSSAD